MGAADRLADAARSVALGMDGDGLFVTLFHAHLDPDTGLICYVDAGHGHCAILRAGGRLERLATRSLPLGVRDGEVFAEGAARLAPGDTLLVWSDGLVERGDRTVGVRDLLPELDAADGAGALVNRLLASTPARPADDVTVVALRRLSAR